MTLSIAVIASILFANQFLDITEIVYAIYNSSAVARILPFIVVLFVFWLLLAVFVYFLVLSLIKTQLGLYFVILVLPMSALPFILLGYPQAVLNWSFMCRSSVVVFALMISIFWMIRTSLSERQQIRLPYLGSIIIFIALYSIHIIGIGPELRLSVIQSIFVLLSVSIFFYFIINYVKGYIEIYGIVKVMAISCILQAILSFFSYYYYVAIKGESIYSFSGFLRDYELFAEYLAIHVPIILFVIRKETGISKKVFTGGLVLVIFVLIATFSRGPLVSLFIGMVYYFIHLRKVEKLSGIFKSILLGVFMIGIMLFAVYMLLPASARIIERFLATDLSTMDTRRDVWLRFGDYFAEKPIIGYGMFYDIRSAKLFWPHSTYLFYLLTLGICGLLNYLIFLFGIIRKGLESARISHSIPQYYELTITLNSALIVFIIDGLKVDYQRYSNYQMFIWLIFALVVCLNIITKEKYIERCNKK
ncbi:MAG: O-antigen ligase family protein [Candidatus Omnitrophota bacterium]